MTQTLPNNDLKTRHRRTVCLSATRTGILCLLVSEPGADATYEQMGRQTRCRPRRKPTACDERSRMMARYARRRQKAPCRPENEWRCIRMHDTNADMMKDCPRWNRLCTNDEIPMTDQLMPQTSE